MPPHYFTVVFHGWCSSCGQDTHLESGSAIGCWRKFDTLGWMNLGGLLLCSSCARQYRATAQQVLAEQPAEQPKEV